MASLRELKQWTKATIDALIHRKILYT